MPLTRSDLPDLMYFTTDGTLRLDTSRAEVQGVRRNYLSASTMNSMDGCHASFAIDKLLREPADPFSPTSSGSSAHAVLEELFSLPPEQRTLEQAADLLSRIHLIHTELDMPQPERYTEWWHDVWAKLRGEFVLNDPATIQVAAVERELKGVEVAGVPFLGKIDRTDVDNPGLKVVDYKTGKVPSAYSKANFGDDGGDQQVLYVMALRAAGEHITGAELHYTKHTDTVAPVRTVVDLSPNVLERVQTKYRSGWDQFRTITDDGIATTKPGGLCNWCALALACPVSMAGKKKPVATDAARASKDIHLDIVRRTVSAPVAKENAMPLLSTTESVRFDERLPDGSINPNGIAAEVVTELSGIAVRLLTEQTELKPYKVGHVQALTSALIVAQRRVAAELTGVPEMNKGVSRLANIAIKQALEVTPPPFDETGEAEWAKWHGQLIKRAVLIVSAGVHAWGEGASEPSFESFTTTDA